MTEPVLTGNSSLNEILAMDNIKQAVWSSKCLYVLTEQGEMKMTGYVEYWRDEGSEESTWTNIASLAPNADGTVALTKDKKVKVLDSRVYAFDFEPDLNLDYQEQSKLASKHKDETPRLWKNWKNVSSVSNSAKHIVALLENGTVQVAGYPKYQTKDGTDYKTGLTLDGTSEVSNWTDIKQV
jgi:hypothetical protein